MFPDPPYRSESSGAPETRFERLVKEQHIVEAARCIIMFVAGDYECLKRMVREELNQAVIGLSGVLVNRFEASRSTNESLRTDTGTGVISWAQRKPGYRKSPRAHA